MGFECVIAQRLKETQKDVFRIAADPMRFGLPMKLIAAKSGIPIDTLYTYANGRAAMPLLAMHKLCGVLPNELLSLLLPGEFCVAQADASLDLAETASRCIDFVAEYASARHPESEAGVDLGPNEIATLRAKAPR